jgi:Eco57I restriction-modification methylase
MAFDLAVIRRYIQAFDFQNLFNYLGWDNHRGQLEIPLDGQQIALIAIAEKRGMVVYRCNTLLNYSQRTRIERQVAKSTFEHLIVYADGQREQIWQWVRRETGKPLANRERRFYRGQTGENIAQVLAQIAFSFDEEETLTLVDVTSRMRATFDVEPVTRRFYDRFKRQHDSFLQFLEGIPDEDLQQWYASVMLNRLMFIYFVQKKGFLDGDVDYLRSHLEQIEGNFYRDFLCPLFFDGFATKHHPQEIRRLLGDVPYLNGGLFMRHQIEELYGEAIQIKNIAFEKLFDFFDEYHWHLDEHPLRNDNEINPDVLGYIFEKYINQKQMGAYYTKEDITEYISKNTVIPFLFDEASKAVNIAFEGEHTLWDLLTENSDRYLYPAVGHGVGYDLPENIAAGLDDVSQREDWNTPAPSDYALPTELWREVVARRKRYAEVCDKLERGEVQQINDLITLNLDIQQFAQDVIDYTDSADVVRAFWKAINRVTVLDPTCGSGAFLFAALNILEPLYEGCLERMEGFVAELERSGGHPQSYSDFREVLARIDQHPNPRYFILKSIIVNNLFGVDIMEEAVEICKLRLFLKLVAQVDDKSKIEPLPDIDFNIRAGNTLVGFATQDEVKRAMSTTTGGQGKLVFGEDQEALAEIERKAADVDHLFAMFRQQQTEIGGEARPEDKSELKRRLLLLEDELNHLLAGQYGVDPTKNGQYASWLKSHEPFHWFVEFYGVIKNGGFDVIIGNPPYVEYSKVRTTYRIFAYLTENCGNLYAYVCERSLVLAKKHGRLGLIIPISGFATERMSELQKLSLESCENTWLPNFGIRPAKLFTGAEQRLSFWIGQKRDNSQKSVTVYSTKYHRWYTEERDNLLVNLQYRAISDLVERFGYPKISTRIEAGILSKMPITKLQKYFSAAASEVLYWHRIAGYFIKAVNFAPYFWSNRDGIKKSDDYKVFGLQRVEDKTLILCVMNSSLFHWFWFTLADGYHCGKKDVLSYPFEIENMADEIKSRLSELSNRLMNDLKDNAQRRRRSQRTTEVEYDEFRPGLSKPIMDEIDTVLAQHYGFTAEELDFIISYDIKYRMGDDLGGDGDERDEE